MNSENHEPNAAPSRRSWRRRIGRCVVLYVVVPYVAVTVIFVALQRKLMYKPTVAVNLQLADVGLDDSFGRDIKLKTDDGNIIRGWLINATGPSSADGGNRPLVLYFPGNSLNRLERLSDLREVAARGFDVLIFDYRGFGDSTGSPSESGLSKDALLAWQFATEDLGYSERQIVVFGESIGGAVALSMWEKSNPDLPEPAAVILSSTFASMPRTVAWHYPFFPFQFLLFDRWPSIERIPNVKSPVILFHGTEDEMVPVDHGKDLADAAVNSTFIEIADGTHNEIPTWQLREKLNGLAELILRPAE